jgi:hypothetical protein
MCLVVRAGRGSAGQSPRSGVRINTYTTEQQISPAVAVDAAGSFVVVWASYGQDGSARGIFGQRYAPIVPVELMHFRVEDDVPSGQRR